MPPLGRFRLKSVPIRVAAISFLNPAPLLYNFEHEPAASALRPRYLVHHTTPARCAAQLHAGEADLGLIPIAQLTPELAVVPGCTIASLHQVRSILLLVRTHGEVATADALRSIRTVAADSASRSSAAYLWTMLRHFYGANPVLQQQPADPLAMLAGYDAALLIGDPALLARERQAEIDRAVAARTGERLLWLDLAALWHQHTGLPWVAAVWALRPQSLPDAGLRPADLITDLNASRDAGLAHINQLVAEWLPRLALPEPVIRAYLTHNIHYRLDQPCLAAIRHFRQLAADAGVLPPLPELRLLQP